MKRLNPETGKPFVYGETRSDGFLFWGYVKTRVKKNGFFEEYWCSKAIFDKRIISTRKIQKDHYKRNKPNINSKNNLWKQHNRDKCNAIEAKRHAAKLKRTPPWLTQEHLQQIESVYALAKQLTADTGVAHHVDHIVPLQGETVSGLHVPWNLRAIPATENQSKSNKW